MFRLPTLLAVAALCLLVNGCAQHHEAKCSATDSKKACCAAPSKGKKTTH